MLVKHTVANLINGVSQQQPSVRLDNQLEEQVNMVSDVTLGLTRRSPVKATSIKAHDASRDYLEEHAMTKFTSNGKDILLGVKKDGSIYTFDQNNSTVLQEADTEKYLTHTDPEDIIFTETDKHIIIANKNVKVEADPESSEQYELDLGTRSVLSSIPDQETGEQWAANTQLVVRHEINAVGYTLIGEDFLPTVDETGMSEYEYDESNITVTGLTPSGTAELTFQLEPVFMPIEPAFRSANTYIRKTVTLGVEGVSVSEILVEVYYGGVLEFSDTYFGLDHTYEAAIAADPIEYVTLSNPDLSFVADTEFPPILDNRYRLIRKSANTRVVSGMFAYHNTRLDYVSQKTPDAYLSEYETELESSYTLDSKLDIYTLNDYVEVTYYLDHPSETGLTHEIKYRSNVALGGITFDTGLVLDEGLNFQREYYDGTTSIRVMSLVSVELDVNAYTYRREKYSVAVITQKSLLPMSRLRVGADAAVLSTYADTDAQTNAVLFTVGPDTYRKLNEKELGFTRFGFVRRNSIRIENKLRSRGLYWLTSIYPDNLYKVVINRLVYDYVLKTYTRTNIYTVTHTATGASTVNSVMMALTVGLVGSPNVLEFNREGGVCHVLFDDKAEYEILFTNGYGYPNTYAAVEASVNINSYVDSVGALPRAVPKLLLNSPEKDINFMIRLQPSIDVKSAYYLTFDPLTNIWSETRLTNQLKLDVTTMPLVLDKNLNTLLVKFGPWTVPLVGDENSNKAPSFLGNTISDMFLFNSRLGFSTESFLVFSEIDNIFNFFRTSSAATLTKDRVDIRLDSNRLGYEKIKHVFILDNKILVTTGRTQSVLNINTDLNLSSAQFLQIGAFSTGDSRPVIVKNTAYFPVLEKDHTNILQFYQVGENRYDATTITNHCSKYIKGKTLSISYIGDLVLVRTDDSANTLYVQNSYTNDGKLIQNAWHKWTFKFPVKFFYSIGLSLKMVFEDLVTANTIHGSLDIVPDQVIPDTDLQIGYYPFLDFSSETLDLSSFVDFINVDYVTSEVLITPSATSVTGYPFESYIVLSEQVPRVEDNGSVTKMGFSTLMLRRIQCTMGLTGRLSVFTSKRDRTTTEYFHVPKGTDFLVLDLEPVSNLDVRFPVNANAKDVVIKVTTNNNFIPFNILSFEYQGQLIARGRRI